MIFLFSLMLFACVAFSHPDFSLPCLADDPAPELEESLDDLLIDIDDSDFEEEDLDIIIHSDEDEEPIEMDTPAKKIEIPMIKTGEAGVASSGGDLSPDHFLESAPSKSRSKSSEKVALDEQPHISNVLPLDSEVTAIGSYTIDPDSVGNPFSAQMIKLMYDEIMNGLNARGVTNRYYMFRDYARMTLNNTNRLVTGSEVDGRSRLSWYDKLYRNPIESVFEVEEYSRYLHAGLSGNHLAIAQALTSMRDKLDIAPRGDDGVKFAFVQTSNEALQEVIRAVTTAQTEFARAVAPLTQPELATLNSQLYNIFTAKETSGHTLKSSRQTGKQLLQLTEKMDRTGIHNALEALIPLSDDHLLTLLKQLPAQRIVTAAGDILIGGPGNDTYDLDSPQMMNVVALIETGGNDVYREGTCDLQRPVFVLIDLAGNDQYIATKPGTQGASILGISMLIDAAGDDSYRGSDVCQGSTLGGAGILIDKSGNDRYHALRRAQGQALAGVGVLIDNAGHDSYHAALWAQGFGNPGGFGVLEDVAGNDRYYLGGLWVDAYEEHPGYDGWGQGLGAGLRGVANGGIGVLLEGGGDDHYEFDYIAHGGGYWLGVGFLRDFGGNDSHIGSTQLDYYGRPRSEARWQRFSNGFGVHYALGYLFEDDGNDIYDGMIMGLGMAWDMSIGFLCDLGGDDQYRATGGLTQGCGAEGSIGILFDYYGSDNYLGGRSASQGYAPPNISYHNAAQCGGNFSFLIDYGGTDKYGSGARNNSYNQRGTNAGFLIDRPLETDPPIEPVVPPQRTQPQPQQRTQPQPQQRMQQQPQQRTPQQQQRYQQQQRRY